MAINQADVLELVKQRLQLADGNMDALIDSYVQEIGQRILHYCNVEEVPDGLKFVWISMVIDVLRIEQSHLPEIEATLASPDVKIGDTSVSSGKSGEASTGKSVIDAVVLNYRVDLNRYRKLRW